MAKFRFAAGTKVRIENVRYRFVTKVEEGWQLVSLSNNVLHNFKSADLYRLYADGKLVLDLDQVDDTPERKEARERRHRLPISDSSPKERERVSFKRLLLHEVAERTTPGTRFAKISVDGKENTVIEAVLADISRENGRKRPVSLSTYYRWRAEYAENEDPRDLRGKFSSRGRKPLHRTVADIIKTVMHEAIQEAKNKNQVGTQPTVTIRRIKRKCEPLIQTACKRDPTIPDRLPSRSTYYNYWKEIPAYDRAVAKYGKTRAREMFRGIRGHRGPEAALERVEYDSTLIPLFFFDEDLGVPLGRAWLNWYIDAFPQMPSGFCLGFEPPGDLTITSALRHACLPKQYVQDEYPNIVHPWLAGGIPRLLQFDNGLAEWGETIENLTDDLDTFYKFARVRTPWFKPIVETLFNVLNQTILCELPGFVLGKSIHPKDYDPVTNGCIGIRHFLYIFHYWLCEIYCREEHGDLGWIPNERWREGTAVHEPEFLDRATDLDLIFGIVREETQVLDHRGVVYAGLRYYSDALHIFRHLYGHRMKVRLKVNPNNLEFVHVWEPRERCWIRVEAIRKDYAKGLTLHRHQLYRKHAKKCWDREEVEDLQRAEQEFQAMIADSLPMALSIRANSAIARAVGIGTQHIFNHVDHDGRLGPLSGPFAGQRLNPLAPISAALPPAGPAPSQGNGHDATAPRKRNIPVYEADYSLGKRRN